MAERSPKPPSWFVAWKFQLERAAISDPRIDPRLLRMFLYVLHRAWPHGDGAKATVPDQDIMDDLPGHAAQSTCYRHREKIQDRGYWTVQPGRGVRATVYLFSDAPVANVLSRIERNAAARKVEAAARHKALADGAETLQTQHKRRRAETLQTRHKLAARKKAEAAPEPVAAAAGTLQTGTQTVHASAGITHLSSHPQGFPDVALEVLPRTKRVRPMLKCSSCGTETRLRDAAGKPSCVSCLRLLDGA